MTETPNYLGNKLYKILKNGSGIVNAGDQHEWDVKCSRHAHDSIRNIYKAQNIKASVLFQNSERKPIISPKLNLATTYSLKDSLSSFGMQSKAGRNSDRSSKVNQDNYFALPFFTQSKSVHLFGVVDGHGPYGRIISTKIAELLPANLRSFEAKHVLTRKDYAVLQGVLFRKLLALEVFAKTQADIVAQCKEDAKDSGATATMVLIAGRTLLCANVGDSRAVLCSEGSGRWEAAQISVDHKPEAETERILRAGGVVDACRGMGLEAGRWRREAVRTSQSLDRKSRRSRNSNE
eukprot:TRINITY_DN8404_c0_g1_i9.p1 TRINITY_DN8404_c0_g1~~TRINITY_DN8404_c0_g1_i9.p1  ORF type:complete len:292 (-),score=37.64 TRINITY_DN8404_c0_g1_i9:351-1226(-)